MIYVDADVVLEIVNDLAVHDELADQGGGVLLRDVDAVS